MFKRIIVESDNQIHPQHQASPPIPIPFTQYPKDFQMSNHIFNQNSLRCQLLVRRFLPGGQLTAFRLFGWRSALFVQSLNALITGIRQTDGFLSEPHFTWRSRAKSRDAHLWQKPCPKSASSVCRRAPVFLRCAAFSCPNNSDVVFFRTFNRHVHHVHHHHFNIRRQQLLPFDRARGIPAHDLKYPRPA